MWGFRGQNHASCSRRLGELSERLDLLEERFAANRLEVLEVAEKVAERLTERTRKRKREEPEETVGQKLARARGIYAVPQR
jgi:hypothetical protein